MEVVLDRFGRILIPKQVRDRLGLKPGATLRLVASESTISLTPAENEVVLEDAAGVLVFTGEIVGDAARITDELAEDRIRKLAGL